MLETELAVIKEVGVAGSILLGVFLLGKWLLQKNAAQIDSMIQRNYNQADALLEMARTTISQNTKAFDQTAERLDQLGDIIANNIKQKESLVTAIHEQTNQIIAKLEGCKQSRDKQLDKILRKQ